MSDEVKIISSSQEELNILDEEGNILGTRTRDEIHKKGLLHGEIHLWLYTPDKKIIFQHRSKTKDTYPDKLDATVGGHVEIGSTFEETAAKELTEETGLKADSSELKFLMETITTSYDPDTHITNYAIRRTYTIEYSGDISKLKQEEGEGTGFEAYTIKALHHLNSPEQKRFIPNLLSPEKFRMYEKILEG